MASGRCLLSFVIAMMLVSCRTAMDYAVPGVHKITLQNIHKEYMLIADEYVKLEKYDKAIEYYTQALDDKEIYWTAYYKLGRAYALAGKWAEAEAVYTRLVERDTENTDLIRSIAYIKGMNGHLNEAMEIYNALLDKNGDDETTIANAAAVLLTQGQNDTARVYIDMLKDKFPESKSLDTLGKALENAQKADTAETESWEEFEKAAVEKPL